MPSVTLPNPVQGVGYTAESNLLNTATIGNLPGDFDQQFGFTIPGSRPLMAQPANNNMAAMAGPYNGPGAGRKILGEPFAVFLGLVLLLVGLKWASEKPDTLGGVNPTFLRIGGYNVFAIVVIAGLANVLWAMIAAKTNIPGVKEFAIAASS